MVPLTTHRLGRAAYVPTWEDMRRFTLNRTTSTADQLWLLQHPPVFTLGQAGKFEHVLRPGDIPVVHTDRGGQVTYHGPGQLVLYPLIDLKRLGVNIRDWVSVLEALIIDYLAERDIAAVARRDAPGVYVDGAKIASIGLRVRKGRCYHGVAFNIDMDLEPFARINPCGMADLPVTQLKTLWPKARLSAVADALETRLTDRLRSIARPQAA